MEITIMQRAHSDKKCYKKLVRNTSIWTAHIQLFQCHFCMIKMTPHISNVIKNVLNELKKKCTVELQTDLVFIPTGVFWFFSITVWHITFFLFNLLRQTVSDFCVLEKWLVQADWQAFEFPVECEDRSYLWWLSHLFFLDTKFKPHIFILKKRSSISALLSLGKKHSNMKCQHLCLPVTCSFWFY